MQRDATPWPHVACCLALSFMWLLHVPHAGVLSTGHCHPKVVEAIQRQARRMAGPYHACNAAANADQQFFVALGVQSGSVLTGKSFAHISSSSLQAGQLIMAQQNLLPGSKPMVSFPLIRSCFCIREHAWHRQAQAHGAPLIGLL